MHTTIFRAHALPAIILIACGVGCGSGTDDTPGSTGDTTSGAGGEMHTGGAGQGGDLGQGGTGQGGDTGQGGTGQGGHSGQGGFGGSFDAPLTCQGTGPIFATHVLATSYGSGQDFGRDAMPDIALGPPEGGGCCQGGLDVVSLGAGGLIVLGFEGNGITDGPGPDFVVFENAFEIGQTDDVFAEPATVEVSQDGVTWSAFPCGADPFDGCAGVAPVLLSGDVAAVDPMSHGGDAFDLADVGLTEARFVRITDRIDVPSVFDLDAVGIVHPVCP